MFKLTQVGGNIRITPPDDGGWSGVVIFSIIDEASHKGFWWLWLRRYSKVTFG